MKRNNVTQFIFKGKNKIIWFTLLILFFLKISLNPSEKPAVMVLNEPQDLFGLVGVRQAPLQQEDWKIPVCFVISAFTQHGGIENWLRGVLKMIEENQEIYTFGVYSWDLVSDEFDKLSTKHKFYYIKTYEELMTHCQIIFSTAHVPILNSLSFNILVIHGGYNSPWSNNYVKFQDHFDYIVGVSADSLLNTDRMKSSYIPSITLDHESECQ